MELILFEVQHLYQIHLIKSYQNKFLKMHLISREDFNLQGKLNTSRHKKGGTNGKTLGNTFLRKQRENEFKQSSPREGKPREESVM